MSNEQNIEKKSLETNEIIENISDALLKLAVLNRDIIENYFANFRKAEEVPPVKFKEFATKAEIMHNYICAINLELEDLKEVSKNG